MAEIINAFGLFMHKPVLVQKFGIDIHAMQAQDAVDTAAAAVDKEKKSAKYVVASAAVSAGVAGAIVHTVGGTD